MQPGDPCGRPVSGSESPYATRAGSHPPPSLLGGGLGVVLLTTLFAVAPVPCRRSQRETTASRISKSARTFRRGYTFSPPPGLGRRFSPNDVVPSGRSSRDRATTHGVAATAALKPAPPAPSRWLGHRPGGMESSRRRQNVVDIRSETRINSQTASRTVVPWI